MSNRARIVSDSYDQYSNYYGHQYPTRSSKRENFEDQTINIQTTRQLSSQPTINTQSKINIQTKIGKPVKKFVQEREPLPPAPPQTGPCLETVTDKIEELVPVVKSMKHEEETAKLEADIMKNKNSSDDLVRSQITSDNHFNNQIRANHPVSLNTVNKMRRMSARSEVAYSTIAENGGGNMSRTVSFSEDETENLSTIAQGDDLGDLGDSENLMNITGNYSGGNLINMDSVELEKQDSDNRTNSNIINSNNSNNSVENSNPTTPNGTQMNRGWRRDAMKMLEAKICSKAEQEKQNEKRKANREAAKRCRQRKQKKTEQLEEQVKELQATLLEVNTNWQKEEENNKKLKAQIKSLKYIVRTHLKEECGQGIFKESEIESNECWKFLSPGAENRTLDDQAQMQEIRLQDQPQVSLRRNNVGLAKQINGTQNYYQQSDDVQTDNSYGNYSQNY